MSVLNKKPFIKTLLESMPTEDLQNLLSLMDGGGDRTPILRTLNTVPGNGRSHFSDADLGVHMCSLQIGYTLYSGYFIMNSEYSVLLQFTDFQRIQMFQIDVAGNNYHIVDEYLDINELRSELDDTNQLEGLDVVGNQATTTIVRDALTNINGRVLTSYEAELHEGNPDLATDYTYYTITYGGEQLTEEQAKNYMEYMTGSRFLPTFSYEKPQNSLFTMADGSIWKPQYMAAGQFAGLRLFKMSSGAGGLPEATAPNKVLVSNEDLEFEERDAVPLADNLKSEPVSNDTMYSAGPTGGLADITTGEESYLREVKGYSIVWNQLLDASHSYTYKSGHYYIRVSNINQSQNESWSLIGPNATGTTSATSQGKIFDLTLMFGGNDKIPFSLSSDVTEYPANGGIPPQTCSPAQAFQRLFANISLTTAPYDSGTIKYVKANKLVETGVNLWNAETMDGNDGTGLLLLAGYTYEIYLNGNGNTIKRSMDGGVTFDGNVALSYKADKLSRTVWIYTPTRNIWIKSSSIAYPIVYVGFVHSGNYCLTTGTYHSSSYARTNMPIPDYQKHEYNINADNLYGIPDNSDNHCSVYDTVDAQRVGSIDLSEYQDKITLRYIEEDNDYAWFISKEDLPQNMDTSGFPNNSYLASKGSNLNEFYNDDEEVIGILIFNDSTTNKPTDTILYPLLEPVATGADPFEPIRIEVNDMGSEYFIQPENTNCPVNQLSQYYENLKDKLVNLQQVDISALNFNASFEALSALKINDKFYKLINQGTATKETSIAIGRNSSAGGTTGTHDNSVVVGYYATGYTNSIVVGSNASSSASDCVVIGKNAGASTSQASGSIVIGCNSGDTINYTCASGACSVVIGTKARQLGDATYSITLGHSSRNLIEKSLSIDGQDSYSTRTYQAFSPQNIWFRFDYVHGTDLVYNNFAAYKSSHFLSEYICNNTLTLQDGKYYVSYTDASNYKTFTSNVVSGTATDITSTITGVHITLKLSTDVVVGIDLLPYDTANSKYFTGYGIASDTPTFVSAYIDSDGCVVINPPAGVTIVEATYNIR